METQLISFDTAKLAKEKGFNIECKEFYSQMKNSPAYIEEFDYYAPEQCILQKWLRTQKGIYCYIDYINEKVIVCKWVSENKDEVSEFKEIAKKDIFDISSNEDEWLEWGLKEALQLIKIKNNGE